MSLQKASVLWIFYYSLINVNTPVCTDFCQSVMVVACRIKLSTGPTFTWLDVCFVAKSSIYFILVCCHLQASIKHFLNRQLGTKKSFIRVHVLELWRPYWSFYRIQICSLKSFTNTKHFSNYDNLASVKFYNYLRSASECFLLNQKFTDD